MRKCKYFSSPNRHTFFQSFCSKFKQNIHHIVDFFESEREIEDPMETWAPLVEYTFLAVQGGN